MTAPGPRRQRQVRRVVAPLAVLGVAVVAAWVAGLVWFAGQIPDRVEDTDTHTDAIVVLTGGHGRLEAGLELLERNLAERLFVSGVYRGVDVKTLLAVVEHGGADLEQRVGIGDATNTRGNAVETAAWAHRYDIRSIRLVTASYHMPRSILEFRHALPDVVIVPHPTFSENVKQAEWWAWPGTAALITGEYAKFLVAYVRQIGESLLARLGAP